MKMKLSKKLALILALVFMIPFWWNQSSVVEGAATPIFKETKVTINGSGETYQLTINNKVTGSSYKWSTSKSSVAKITSKGLITAVNKGTSTITCKITYPSKKTKSITCKVTVKIPATDININNASEVNGTHTLILGQSYDFNCDLTPSNTSDTTYWSVEGGDPACISIDDATSGKVTALKAGKVILRVTAAKAATKTDAAKSIINDAVIIEAVAPTATVKSVDFVGSTDLKVVFDSPVDKNTIIGTNNKLLGSIEITLRKNTKGVLAQDPGTLTANLSADNMTLTITASNKFEGDYGINFTNQIKTTDGVALEEYYKQLTYIDTIPPAILSTELDDSGMITTIRFTEAIDFTNFKVSNATVLPSSGTIATADPVTISTLNNKLNYIVSDDKKSLTINLSKIAVTDYNKLFTVVLSGIKDMSGNAPASYTLSTTLRTDTTPKPQATPLYVRRTSYNTLTATFSRAIQNAGLIQIAGGSMINGVVDPANNKVVNYTITDSDALLSGIQTVSLGYWNSYNVSPSDTSSQQMRTFSVDFTVDKTNPVLLSYDFDQETGIMTLNFNKDVNLTLPSGIFSATLNTVTDDIRSGTNITYSKLASTDNKIIKLQLSNMSLLGTYTFTLDQGFVTDNYRNQNLARTLTITNNGGSASELPAPYAIIQSSTNLSQISLEFANKLDMVSAQTVSNYSIAGVTVLSALVTKNTSDNGATVLLTVADGSIDITTDRPMTISGIKGYNGSFSEMSPYTTSVNLKDNKKPYFVGTPVFDKTAKNVIHLNFNEEVQGTLSVKVTQIGTVPMEYTTTVTTAGSSVNITLGNPPPNGTYLKIDVLSITITDLSGNPATIPTTMGVVVSY